MKTSKPLTRKIPSGFDDELIEIDTYQRKHWPENQERVLGRFPLNPTLREWFDNTPNDQREALEVKHWWDLPFIVAESWDQRAAWDRDRHASLRAEGADYAKSVEDLEAEHAARKVKWYESWPSGTRYEVRCLDGGAWDRSTNWGMVATLEEAIAKCAQGPTWRAGLDQATATIREAAGLALAGIPGFQPVELMTADYDLTGICEGCGEIRPLSNDDLCRQCAGEEPESLVRDLVLALEQGLADRPDAAELAPLLEDARRYLAESGVTTDHDADPADHD